MRRKAVLDYGSVDFEELEEPAPGPRRPGLPVEPRRVWQIVLGCRRPLLLTLIGASALAFVASFFVPQTYESSSQLVYEGVPLLDRRIGGSSPDAFVESAVAPGRLREVRDRLGWEVPAEVLAGQVFAIQDTDASMRIVAEASTAEDAHALAKAVLDVFLEHQASFNAERFERVTAETEAGLVSAKERREAATLAFDEFRRKSGKPNVLQEQEELLVRAADVRAAADEAAVEVSAQQAKIAELEKAQKELPRQIVGSATRGSPIDSPLAEARSELAAARASLSEQHPRVQALKQRVASLQAQRRAGKAELGEQTLVSNPARSSIDQQIATTKAALAAARERETALRALLADIMAEAAALAPEEAEARRIFGELEATQERVEVLTERVAKLRDAAQNPTSGFRVLSIPTVPEESKASSAYLAMLFLLPPLAVLVAALGFIAHRLRRLTVVAPREVAWWGNGPVVGTTTWPRDASALEPFVDELEDLGVYGAGRTLVVPATERERELACSFAMRLAEAPWLSAAILDVGDRAAPSGASTIVTPPPGAPPHAPRRLSSQATPAVRPGTRPSAAPPSSSAAPPSQRAPHVDASIPLVTPAPPGNASQASTRPPRKKTMIGLPAVRSSNPPPAAPTSTPPSADDRTSTGPEPFRRMRGPRRATVRMVVPNRRASSQGALSTARSPEPDASRGSEADGEAFLLTRPVQVENDPTPAPEPSAPGSTDAAQAEVSDAVMHAAVRLLGDGDDDVTGLRRSHPPAQPRAASAVRGVALAWNGPLSGPVLRRAARLAHRVIVVVSSGMSSLSLSRLPTRLGREAGLGYVLIDVTDDYVDLPDRVGPVEAFWEGSLSAEPSDAKRP